MSDRVTRFGYTGKILWLDLSARTFELEERDDIFWRRYIGGGLLATKLLLEKTRAGIDPYDPSNLLIFTSSVAAGHPAAGLARFTTASKSPLTFGIGETRTEGPWAMALKASGADAIVCYGKATEPLTIVVEDGRPTFLSAKELWGLDTTAVTDKLKKVYGSETCIAAIGPAGENLVRFASIVTEYSHQAARMGMGAVMGSKNLKALAIVPSAKPALFDQAFAARISKEFDEEIPGNSLSSWQKNPPGFSCWLYLHGLDAALCVNNYSKSTIAGIENFKEEEFLRRHLGPLSCAGCSSDCLKRIHPLDREDLDPRASGIHQEVTGTMGVNLGVTDLDSILAANNLCNRLGMDPVSLGFTISMAMELREKNLWHEGPDIRFGDAEAMLRLTEQIAMREGAGDILAEGSKKAAEIIGGDAASFAMHVKGLEMVCFEPRSQTNLALGYAVAPIGPRYDICEHDWDFDTVVGWEHTLNLSRTVGILKRTPMNTISPEKVVTFKALLTLWSAADAFDFCIFVTAPTRIISLPRMSDLLHAVTGWETSSYEMMRAGERRLHLMRAYNFREGHSESDDRLPERFYSEPIAEGPRKGDVIDKLEFEAAIRTFYEMMGWDKQGAPLRATLYDAGISPEELELSEGEMCIS